jgi:hypothetical protein
MHVKFLSHDKGSGRAAVAYLLGEKDSQGRVRADVQVLRGNPEQLGQLIDSLKFVNRYSSAVIAFHKDDEPTDAEIQNVLDDFERVAFAGLKPNQYAWSAVLHEESDGSKHIHIIAPRVELTTGKSMNIAPPGWQRRYDPMRDALNYEHGWARPDDPRLARLVQPGPVGNFAGWKAGTDARQQITEWLTAQIASGQVNNRQDVLNALASIGQINRQGRDYISIRVEDGAKPIRLKGAIYDEEFNGETLREAATAAQRRPEGREQPDLSAAHEARARLAEVIRGCAEYNEKRYPEPEPSHREVAQRDLAAPALANDVATVVQRLPISGDRGRDDPVELVASQQGRDTGSRQTAADKNVGSGVLQESSGSAILQEEGVKNDGIREITYRAIEQAQRSARAAIQAVERCTAAASAAYRSVVSACRKTDAVAPVVRANMNLELDRFKQEINLVEYAETMGYEYDKKQSSKASAVLRRNGEKIIIATDKDGHGIYFNVGDSKDNGSIIDFIQKRNNMNLGEIRKVLRPWIGVSNQPVLRATKPATKPVATTRDRAAAVAAWEGLKPYTGDYLQAERKLSAATVAAFGDRIRQDARGNVCFRHIDKDGVTGYEIKNKSFTGFANGGEKAVFTCRINEDKPVSKVIVTESAIDAMSYYEMNGVAGEGVIYLSFGGGMSERQKQVLRDYLTIEGLTDKVHVIAATDNDAAGDAFAAEINKIRPDALRDKPDAKDWNDMLKLDVLNRSQRVSPEPDYYSPSFG